MVKTNLALYVYNDFYWLVNWCEKSQNETSLKVRKPMSTTPNISIKTIIHLLLDSPDDVQRIYGVDVYTLISSMVDTNDKDVLNVLTTVASTDDLHDIKQTPKVTASFKTQLNKSVKKRNALFKSNKIKKYLLKFTRTICQTYF